MIKVETPYHFITSGHNTLPKYTCAGKCKSVFWEDEEEELGISSPLHIPECKKCGGSVRAAHRDDYKVISIEKKIDFKNGVTVHLVHEVKPEFEEMAKREWC